MKATIWWRNYHEQTFGESLIGSGKSTGQNFVVLHMAQSHPDIHINGYNPSHKRRKPFLPVLIQHNVAVLHLGLPKASAFPFSAGQCIDLLLPGNITRSYPIADTPGQIGFLELHIRRREQNACSNMIFNQPPALKGKGVVRIKGTFGIFGL
ncbi:FAD-binding oxidoreductase [Neisseria iguanae]|uniref:FAD-binding FR-type domain-containing protein n=1 Tax=Neisseria iguanae TaxID=90242 RepID=A0A2P7U2Z2_9NEIS|nr:FAD-binding oxidoreductase [Neisseria iguanae]PSJ81344.1 hypothetical protein C7N83_01355 [Neisseria iguanae]